MHFKIEVSLFITLMISWVSCQDCGNSKLTENSGEFMSPNYPKRYNHKVNCSWTITAPEGHFIEVSFEKFDVKNPFWSCEYDNVTVFNGKKQTFCNDNRPPELIKSVTNTLTFRLVTDRFFTNGVGFKAKYNIVDENGNKLDGEDDDSVDGWDDDSTTMTTTSTTTTTPATTSTTTTPAMTSTTSKPTTTSTTTAPTTTTSTLITKLISSVAVETTTTLDDNGGISGDPGAMSGVLIGVIVCVVLIIFGTILIIAFVRYRRNKNKRIDLSVIEVADGKELISDDKIYKKQGKKIVRVPEAETFPL